MMNPEIKARWLEKLRSGEYLQGTNFLKQVDIEGRAHYCCLGVLCEIAVEDGILRPGVPQEGPGLDDSIYRYRAVADDNDRNTTVLPRAVATWAGINADGVQEFKYYPVGERPPCPNRGEGDHSCGDSRCGNCFQQELTDLNDTWVSFDDIADVIEKWF